MADARIRKVATSRNTSFAFVLSRSAILIAFLLPSLRLVALGEDAKPAAITLELSAVDRLYRAGKFVEAEAGYQSLIKTKSNIVPAQIGLVRTMLRLNRIDEALDTVNSALAGESNSAALLATKGDVQFRRAELSDAESSYLAAKELNPSEVGAYLGLAGLYNCSSLYKKSYEELQMAHKIAPYDPVVQRAWLSTVAPRERVTALKAYLGRPGLDDEEAKQMTGYLEFLKATVDKPIHACRIVSKVDQTEAKLETVYAERRRLPGLGIQYGVGMPAGRGLSVRLNNRKSHSCLIQAPAES